MEPPASSNAQLEWEVAKSFADRNSLTLFTMPVMFRN